MSEILLPNGWAIVRLKDLCEVKQGKNLSSDKFNTQGLGLPYITGASSIQGGMLDITRWTQHPAGIISRKNDIIVSCVGTLGKIGVNQIGDCVLSKHCFALTPLPGIMHEYLLLALGASIHKIIPEDDGEGGTGFSKHLEKEEIEQLELKLKFPAETEQQEITDRMVLLAQGFIPATKRYSQAAKKDLPPEFEKMSCKELIQEIRKLDRKCANELRKLEALLPDSELKEEIKAELQQGELFS